MYTFVFVQGSITTYVDDCWVIVNPNGDEIASCNSVFWARFISKALNMMYWW